MKKVIIIFGLLLGLVVSPVFAEATTAVSKSAADEAYTKGNYRKAIELYEALLQQGESAEIYYNLGNSYYKNEQMARAVLNYERALLLNPGDGDIRFNLEMARSKTVDKVTPMSEVFLVTWTRAVKNWMSADGWAQCGILCFLLFLCSVALYLFGRKVVLKKIGFALAAVMLVLMVVANLFANSQKQTLETREYAIVMSPSVTAKSTPDEGGTDLFVLHEGHKVSIKDATMKSWVEIKLEDGNVGWIPVSAIERI